MHSIRQAETSKTAVASRKIAPKEEVSLVTYSVQCLNSRIESGILKIEKSPNEIIAIFTC